MGDDLGLVMVSQLIFVGERRHGTAVVTCAMETRSRFGVSTGPARRLRLPRLRTKGFRQEARHSPTGFEWGYEGSGPAELARAILRAVFPADDAVREPRCYQRFKRDVVARLDRQSWRLTGAEVRAWRELFDAGARVDAARAGG